MEGSRYRMEDGEYWEEYAKREAAFRAAAQRAMLKSRDVLVRDLAAQRGRVEVWVFGVDGNLSTRRRED